MVGYAVLLVCLVASGFGINYFSLSWLWGIIPALIGGFYGSYNSQFGQMLTKPNISEAQREKLLSTTRILTVAWTVLSCIFVAMGYSFVYFVHI